MKNLLKIGLSVVVLMSTGCASTKIKASNSVDYEKATILENGVKRTVRVQSGDVKVKDTVSKIENKDSKDGIIVKFKDDSAVSIKEFESKYSLKLKTKLIIGYYIFENDSKRSDLDIVSAIINSETNVKTVKPNWKMRNVTY